MTWRRALKKLVLLQAWTLAAIVVVALVYRFGGSSAKDPETEQADVAAGSGPGGPRSVTEVQRLVDACGETPPYVYEDPRRLFGAARVAELPALRLEADRYVGCLRDVLRLLETSESLAIVDAPDDLRSRVQYLDQRLRIRAELQRTGASIETRLASLEEMVGRCPDPPLGELRDVDALGAYARWLDCRRDERDAIRTELEAIRSSVEGAVATPDVQRRLQAVSSRLDDATTQIATAERNWSEAQQRLAREDAESRADEPEDWGAVSSRSRERARNDAPRCTCDEARRGICGSPATHCYSDEEIAARRRASRQSALESERRRRERQVATADRRPGREAERQPTEASTTAERGRVLETVRTAEGATLVRACHNARAAVVHDAFAPLGFSEYRDDDTRTDGLCSCRREGDTWRCSTTAVYREVSALPERWPNPGFGSDDSRSLACTEAKTASRAITAVTSYRFLGYRIVLGSDDNCRCERDERLGQWDCSTEAWMSR